MSVIKPTVGRKVWFYPNRQPDQGPLIFGAKVMQQFTKEPLDATILCTWGDRCVNLLVVDHAGETHALRSVTLRQGDEEAPAIGYYCGWMPYQMGQAAKTQEALAKPQPDSAS